MPLSYKAPLRDIRFLTNEVFNYTEHYKTLKCGQNADPETVDMMLDSIADYCSNVLMPLYQSGDAEGCHFDNGKTRQSGSIHTVRTRKGSTIARH